MVRIDVKVQALRDRNKIDGVWNGIRIDSLDQGARSYVGRIMSREIIRGEYSSVAILPSDDFLVLFLFDLADLLHPLARMSMKTDENAVELVNFPEFKQCLCKNFFREPEFEGAEARLEEYVADTHLTHDGDTIRLL